MGLKDIPDKEYQYFYIFTALTMLLLLYLK